MAVWLADWYVWQMHEGLCWLRSVLRATEESAVGLWIHVGKTRGAFASSRPDSLAVLEAVYRGGSPQFLLSTPR